LVKHGKSWAGIDFSVDFDDPIYRDSLKSNKYNILIFDKNYNYLNKFNSNFDGTAFNGHLNHYSYLITRDRNFSIENYDLVYHIFFGCFSDFNKQFNFPAERQIIHLYPGGGYSSDTLEMIAKGTQVVSTNPIVSNELRAKGVEFIECLTAPLYMKNEKVPEKVFYDERINICFSSIGHGKEKGARKYWIIALLYKITHFRSKVRFFSVGNCLWSPFITKLSVMSFRELEQFYHSKIDIYMNLSSRHAFNGWPLGMEAAKNGVVLMTTDPHCVSELYNANEYAIKPLTNIFSFFCEIHKFDKGIISIKTISNQHKHFAQSYAGYENQQRRVFDLIDKRFNLESR
jgi:hypothetical protein